MKTSGNYVVLEEEDVLALFRMFAEDQPVELPNGQRLMLRAYVLEDFKLIRTSDRVKRDKIHKRKW